MKIFITHSFRRKYFSKYKYIDIDRFVSKLKQANFLNLKYPYLKFKLKITSVAFRGTLIILENGDIIILTLYLKKDKKSGYNITWSSSAKEILSRQKLAISDIENEFYEIY